MTGSGPKYPWSKHEKKLYTYTGTYTGQINKSKDINLEFGGDVFKDSYHMNTVKHFILYRH